MRKIRKGNVDHYADSMWRDNLRLALTIIGATFGAVGIIALEYWFFPPIY